MNYLQIFTRAQEWYEVTIFEFFLESEIFNAIFSSIFEKKVSFIKTCKKFLACFYKGNFFFENRRKNRVENFGFQKKLKNRNFISFLSSGENLEVIHWEIRKLEPIRSSFSHIFFLLSACPDSRVRPHDYIRWPWIRQFWMAHCARWICFLNFCIMILRRNET